MFKNSIAAKGISLASLLLLLLLASAQLALAADEEILFLHHSTGRNVYNEGDVPEWISDYNDANGTNYQIQERSYPTGSYSWSNYPYDYWNLWINGACDSGDPDIECLDSMAADYDVIIFKHCFPGSDIVAGTGTGFVDSSTKTLENYKLQYRALRDLMDTFTDTIFIVWTLPPRHRLATNADNAARAAQFVNWVKNNFLTEDGQAHPNIFIFDFWGIVAEQNPDPANGEVNRLKYDYERSHSSSDSHPNTLANEAAGPIFAERIVNAIQAFQTGNAVPTADAGQNQEVAEGAFVTLDGSSSNDPDGNIASYAWIQISGTAVAISSPNTAQATFTAPEVDEEGETLKFELTVTDAEGLMATDTSEVFIEGIGSSEPGNTAPTADAGQNQEVAKGAFVTLDGSSSNDPDGNIANYAWVQISGTTVAISSPNTVQATFTAPEVDENGEALEFELTVTDAEGLAATDTSEVFVEGSGSSEPVDPSESNGSSSGCFLLLLSD